ncbi:MAG TPA: lytic transglycosylase domain-containing protein, partial [Ramlibacter sp.]|nr:lytic transglycosylase domain-containing protein [Ramlibacter sp.]
MKLRSILASLALVLVASTQAQPRDDVLLDMEQAFRQGKQDRLTQLLPQAQGHPLEAWAAYWELRTRLDTASPQEIRQFLTRYAGSYQEDRLRNDWLLLLGQQRDWDNFAQEYPLFRMNDDREVRCYALLAQGLREGAATPASVGDEVLRLWLNQRDTEEGCTAAAAHFINEAKGPARLKEADAWRKARQAMELNRPAVAGAALAIIHPEALPLLNELTASPAKFLARRSSAGSKLRREMVGMALARLAASDVEGAATQLENKWGPQLPPEERDWLWGLLGRQAAFRLLPEAHGYFARVQKDSHLGDSLLEWKVRAALRAGAAPAWRS